MMNNPYFQKFELNGNTEYVEIEPDINIYYLVMQDMKKILLPTKEENEIVDDDLTDDSIMKEAEMKEEQNDPEFKVVRFQSNFTEADIVSFSEKIAKCYEDDYWIQKVYKCPANKCNAFWAG